MAGITPNQRKEIETLIYSTFDAVDKSHTNSDYYRKLFATMDDSAFYKFLQRRLPFRFHTELFKIEPKMYEIFDAFKVLNKPLLEKVNVPHIYRNSEGKAVKTKECAVIYIHLKRLKQTVAKKTNVAIDIEKRDMRRGTLVGEDKGGKETDREFESLAVMGLDYNTFEFSRPRGDSLKAMSQMNAAIASKGYVSKDDITVETDDSLGKSMLNVYLIGANIYSNVENVDYMTPYTIKNKHPKVNR